MLRPALALLAAVVLGLMLVSRQPEPIRAAADDVITTLAGTSSGGYSGDGGAATAAHLKSPTGVTASSDGTVYIADTGNHRVRKVAADGTISTVAGTSSAGFSGDGGPATAAPTLLSL